LVIFLSWVESVNQMVDLMRCGVKE